MNPYKYVCDLQIHKVTPAQEAMEASLLSLLDEKDLHKISVKEICERANLARSTFYAYYDVIDDCLAAIENRFLHELLDLNMKRATTEKNGYMDLSFSENTMRYIQNDKKMLYLFLIKRYNYRFVNRWKYAIKYYLYPQMPVSISDPNKELTLEVIASGIIGAYRHWLKNPYDLDTEYVKRLIRRALESYSEF